MNLDISSPVSRRMRPPPEASHSAAYSWLAVRGGIVARRRGRNIHDEAAALVDGRFNAYRSAEQGGDDIAGDGQAEAGALAERLGGEELVEDLVEIGGTDAAAVIADRNHHRALIAANIHADRPLFKETGGVSVDRIDDQIGEYLAELSRVAEDQRVGAAGDLERAVGQPQAVGDQGLDLLKELAHRERAAFFLLQIARVGLEAAYMRRGLVDPLARVGHQHHDLLDGGAVVWGIAGRRRPRQFFDQLLNQFQRGHRRAQRGVHLVRDTGAQAA